MYDVNPYIARANKGNGAGRGGGQWAHTNKYRVTSRITGNNTVEGLARYPVVVPTSCRSDRLQWKLPPKSSSPAKQADRRSLKNKQGHRERRNETNKSPQVHKTWTWEQNTKPTEASILGSMYLKKKNGPKFYFTIWSRPPSLLRHLRCVIVHSRSDFRTQTKDLNFKPFFPLRSSRCTS